MKNISNNVIVVGIVGLVLGLVLGWLIGNSGMIGGKGGSEKKSEKISIVQTDAQTSESNNSNALSFGAETSLESESAILVMDQGAGSVATVASVETDMDSWVVIREDNNGVLGNILGAARIDAGDSNNIVVNLLRPTEAGRTYQVVLFADNNDRAFDHKIDLPLTSDGVLISKSFKVSAQ